MQKDLPAQQLLDTLQHQKVPVDYCPVTLLQLVSSNPRTSSGPWPRACVSGLFDYLHDEESICLTNGHPDCATVTDPKAQRPLHLAEEREAGVLKIVLRYRMLSARQLGNGGLAMGTWRWRLGDGDLAMTTKQ